MSSHSGGIHDFALPKLPFVRAGQIVLSSKSDEPAISLQVRDGRSLTDKMDLCG